MKSVILVASVLFTLDFFSLKAHATEVAFPYSRIMATFLDASHLKIEIKALQDSITDEKPLAASCYLVGRATVYQQSLMNGAAFYGMAATLAGDQAPVWLVDLAKLINFVPTISPKLNRWAEACADNTAMNTAEVSQLFSEINSFVDRLKPYESRAIQNIPLAPLPTDGTP